MSEVDREEARKAVESMLQALSIGRVVYVDDSNVAAATLEDVIVAAQGLEAEVLELSFPELGESVSEDPDVRGATIRRVWDSLGTEIQAERSQAILNAFGSTDDGATDEVKRDVSDASILGELILGPMLVSLSPEQWSANRAKLLLESKGLRTLFLFDRDFSPAGGDPDAGVKIIADLLSAAESKDLICGLLTHTVSVEDQPIQSDSLCKTYGIPRDRFVLIPKAHLSNSPMSFAQALKFVALAPDFQELKCKTTQIINAAAAEATRRIERVGIHDLEHIVFRVTADEGVWEPDMLFRLHAMFHRIESRRLAHEGGVLESISAKLRSVSGIPLGSGSLVAPASAWELQREELYEFGDHINRNHLPLELGDIFERVGDDLKKKFILLAQPCDLMVRRNGERQPELRRMPLAELVSPKDKPYYSEEIPYFDVSPASKWFVKFKAIHFVRSSVLDLSVFDPNGSARLTIGGSAPAGIRPTWKKRHEFLSKAWRCEIARASVLEPVDNEPKHAKEVRRQIADKLSRALFEDSPFSGKTSKNAEGHPVVEYNCKRIARLSRARAVGLLMSYTSTIGRTAQDHLFGDASERAPGTPH